MLRFIVLGQIPGTTIQVNFTVLLLIGLIGLLIFEMIANNHRRQVLEVAHSEKAVTAVKKTKSRSTKKMKTTKKKADRKKAKKITARG